MHACALDIPTLDGADASASPDAGSEDTDDSSSTDGEVGSDGGASADSSGGSSADGGDCEDTCGTQGCGDCPAGAPQPVPGQDFAIDGSEITKGAYLSFLDASPSLAMQSEVCDWNSEFQPGSDWPPTESELGLPVVYVNWCQAQAYCAWAGGRLCGKIGGGTNIPSQYALPDKSEWFNACSSNGARDYAYGSSYSPDTCNGEDYLHGAALPVTEPPDCRGPFGNLHNLSGNVFEWTNECELGNGADDLCRRRGGSFFSAEELLRCDAGSSRSRDYVDHYTGFRCCHD
jgi:formylglycine-generating enzyme required for sulfatase activity